MAGLNNLSGLRPFCEVVNVYYNIYIFFYMFLRHYPYSCFLSLFIFFRVCVWKQETRVHPSHQRRKPDKQRGFRAWTHPSQVFTKTSQMAWNGEPLVHQKSEMWTLFYSFLPTEWTLWISQHPYCHELLR